MSARPAGLGCHIVGRTGVGSLTPVIFLHGFGGVAEGWRELQLEIAEHAPTLAFDLPGHGGSLHVPNFGPPKVAAKSIIDEIYRRGIHKAHLVGHSMGGAVACLIALFATHKIASLTLLAPGGFGEEIATDHLQEWARARTKSEIGAIMPKLSREGFEVGQESISRHERIRAQPAASDALRDIADQLFTGSKQGILPLDAIIATGLPMKLLWGREDSILPVSQAEVMQSKIDTTIIDGVGHMLDAEAPGAVKQAILVQLATNH